MKRICPSRFWIGIALSLVLLAQSAMPARASDNPQRKQLEAIYDALKRSYPSLIRMELQNQIDGYFLMRFEDFTSTSAILRSRIQKNHARLQELRKNWAEVTQSLAIPDEQAAITLIDIFRETQMISAEAQILEQDLKELQAGWSERCDDPLLEFANKRFSSRATFTPTTGSLAPDAGSWFVGVKMHFSGDSAVPGVESKSSADVAGALGTTGAAIGAFVPPLGWLVGAIVGSAIGFAVSTFEYASEMNQQWELIGDIWKFQEKEINSLATESSSLIHSRCMVSLTNTPEGTISMSEALACFVQDASSHRSAALDLMKQVSDSIDQTRARIADRLDAILEHHFTQIESSYMLAIQKRFAASQQADAEALDFLDSRVFTPTTQNPSAVTADSLWETLIEGDIRFNAKSSFSFSEPSDPIALDGSQVWNSSVAVVTDMLREKISGKAKEGAMR